MKSELTDIHLLFRIWAIRRRSWGRGASIPLTSSLASDEMLSHRGPNSWYSPRMILFLIPGEMSDLPVWEKNGSDLDNEESSRSDIWRLIVQGDEGEDSITRCTKCTWSHQVTKCRTNGRYWWHLTLRLIEFRSFLSVIPNLLGLLTRKDFWGNVEKAETWIFKNLVFILNLDQNMIWRLFSLTKAFPGHLRPPWQTQSPPASQPHSRRLSSEGGFPVWGLKDSMNALRHSNSG